MLLTEEPFDFSFNPTACESCGGLCCLGESGYVRISDDEIDALAEHLGVSLQKMHKKYLIKADEGYSLREIRLSDGNYSCMFFDLEKKQCSIYEYRPEQCRTFPFWDEYFIYKDETFYMCPGIRMGR